MTEPGLMSDPAAAAQQIPIVFAGPVVGEIQIEEDAKADLVLCVRRWKSVGNAVLHARPG